MIDVAGNDFALTNGANGVDFDINGDGIPDRISWTRPGSDDAWLVLDRNGNGTIDDGTELFGNFTPQAASKSPNGFSALNEYDEPRLGGNRDGVFDKRDAIYSQLRLWQDTNHDGISQPAELHGLRELGMKAISLDYRESKRTDEFGNRFGYRAKVLDSRNSSIGHWAVDVFLIKHSSL